MTPRQHAPARRLALALTVLLACGSLAACGGVSKEASALADAAEEYFAASPLVTDVDVDARSDILGPQTVGVQLEVPQDVASEDLLDLLDSAQDELREPTAAATYVEVVGVEVATTRSGVPVIVQTALADSYLDPLPGRFDVVEDLAAQAQPGTLDVITVGHEDIDLVYAQSQGVPAGFVVEAPSSLPEGEVLSSRLSTEGWSVAVPLRSVSDLSGLDLEALVSLPPGEDSSDITFFGSSDGAAGTTSFTMNVVGLTARDSSELSVERGAEVLRALGDVSALDDLTLCPAAGAPTIGENRDSCLEYEVREGTILAVRDSARYGDADEALRLSGL